MGNSTLANRYTTSLYTVLLGDLQIESSVARTNQERGFALISVLMNGFLFGSVAATLSSIFMSIRAPYAEYNAKMDVLRTWMRTKHLPLAVRTIVERFYDRKLAMSEKKVIDERAIIEDLRPSPLATELVHTLYAT
eukprot:SAG11_NODE_20551_length_443_cov_0.747093_1_plen_135_part_01